MSYANGPAGEYHNTMTKRMTDAMPKAHGLGIQAKTSNKSIMAPGHVTKKVRRAG